MPRCQVLKQVLPADGNKRVQEAGISALSVIMEESYYYIFDPVVNQLVPILRVFNQVRVCYGYLFVISS